MPSASLDITAGNDAEFLSAIVGLSDQLPYAYSLAINKTVNDAQQAIQAKLPSEFTLRRAEFISKTIYRKPGQDFATKTNLVGTVRVNPDRNFLAKFEDGGQKTSEDGASLAIPVQRMQTPGLIINRGSPLQVKRVMALIASQGGKQVGPFKRRATKRSMQQSFYIVHSRKGHTVVVQRDGANTRVIYDFEKAVPIKDRLHFEDTAMEAALAHWEENIYESIDHAIETAR